MDWADAVVKSVQILGLVWGLEVVLDKLIKLNESSKKGKDGL